MRKHKKQIKKRKFSKVDKEMRAWAEIMKEGSIIKREEQRGRHEEDKELLNKILEGNILFFA